MILLIPSYTHSINQQVSSVLNMYKYIASLFISFTYTTTILIISHPDRRSGFLLVFCFYSCLLCNPFFTRSQNNIFQMLIRLCHSLLKFCFQLNLIKSKFLNFAINPCRLWSSLILQQPYVSFPPFR